MDIYTKTVSICAHYLGKERNQVNFIFFIFAINYSATACTIGSFALLCKIYSHWKLNNQFAFVPEGIIIRLTSKILTYHHRRHRRR